MSSVGDRSGRLLVSGASSVDVSPSTDPEIWTDEDGPLERTATCWAFELVEDPG